MGDSTHQNRIRCVAFLLSISGPLSPLFHRESTVFLFFFLQIVTVLFLQPWSTPCSVAIPLPRLSLIAFLFRSGARFPFCLLFRFLLFFLWFLVFAGFFRFFPVGSRSRSRSVHVGALLVLVRACLVRAWFSLGTLGAPFCPLRACLLPFSAPRFLFSLPPFWCLLSPSLLCLLFFV